MISNPCLITLVVDLRKQLYMASDRFRLGTNWSSARVTLAEVGTQPSPAVTDAGNLAHNCDFKELSLCETVATAYITCTPSNFKHFFDSVSGVCIRHVYAAHIYGIFATYASDFLFGPQYRLYSCELKTTLVLKVCLQCLDLSSNKQVFVG